MREIIIEEETKVELGVRKVFDKMEVLGELCRIFYEKFGKEALSPIRAVFRQWGKEIGEKKRQSLGQKSFREAIFAYMEPATKRDPKPDILFASDEKVEIKVYTCPYRLNNLGIELCEAMMAMDYEIIKALLPNTKVRLRIVKCLANGDDFCHAIFERL